ncbi:MAG: hypothetical protein HN736_07820 [Anaerolineae bacterium]|jgi:tetratricopeptide (TPR) repeat protein|nr:hypothetical protein [Anaerolineae bacterium]MBT4311761.1 hypothetical protein [Anaerolineae bacterium]MBT4457317.1 hypothetical protein [Anaerolineae bacterium]MBT4843428.1 hypothetical protein [Anaerolineae bacterium]MBT6062022.1 hypothetical protein [Anaerolineae bacterium]
MSEIIEETQPIKKQKKSGKKRFWITLLGFIVIVSLGVFGGYNSGIDIRTSAEATLVSGKLDEQFQLGAIALAEGRYDHARQHFEYIVQHNASYPGAAAGMAEAILGMSFTATPVPTLTPTLTPTPDMRGVEAIYANAQQLINAGDWTNALAALDQLRKDDPNYRTAEVDGMYYFALRYNGADKISKIGDLEGGIYFLTLAERFGPLDSTANNLRENARLYIIAASFWEINWEQAVNYFGQLATYAPNIWDGASNLTAGERYRIALMRYGDQLYNGGDNCGAYAQYSNALAYGALDEVAAKNSKRAYEVCYPPTATPEPTAIVIIDTPTETPVTP